MSKKLYQYRVVFLLAAVIAMAGCSERDYSFWLDQPDVDIINIGGVDTDELMVSATTRAQKQDAETVSWLVQPLKNGLDITYGLSDATPNHEDVAILKLSTENGGDPFDKEGDLAVYTFKYRANRSSEVGEGNNAIWYNNGYHYFQGVHVPERIRYNSDVTEVEGTGKAPGLVLDQHNDKDTGADAELGNYTLLSHYLGMPANYRLTATVERIKLPFRHRLARVVAFVLIDPELNTTLKGYKKNAQGETIATEDPNTTSIRFCNVKVLQGVKDVEDASGHHTLTPTWTQARKVIPHFDGERGSYNYSTQESLDENFKFYYKETDGKATNLYPSSTNKTPNWKTVHEASDHKGYIEVNYGKVPVYDIIVRPTYTDADHVMYDEVLTVPTETKAKLAAVSNKIDFELELENGLRYEKEFEFDLDANYQTVVYLRISREHVDYNAAGSDLWVEDKKNDGWYGVDNENGNTLSMAGSSWQRAYTYGYQVSENATTPNSTDGVTDGHFYNASSSAEEREKAQYFSSAYKDIWVEKFLQAYQGGPHHGDYFVLRDNIEIDARLIPENFVFTGHLDGQDKTITLTNCDQASYKEAINITDLLFTKSGSDYTSWAKPEQLYVKNERPVYYSEDDIAKVDGNWYDKSTLIWKEEVVILDTPEDKVVIPAHYEKTSESKSVTLSDIKEYITEYIPATAETTPSAPTTLEQLKTDEYYTNVDGTPFTCPELYQYSHQSQAFLFAGLNGAYTTAQESATNPYANGVVWEANVHKETNKSAVWVPTAGYRAEVLNVKMVDPAKLFMEETVISGNVQNCWNGTTAIANHTPAIPQYK